MSGSLLDDELECLAAIYSPEELSISDLPPLLAHLNKRIALVLPNDCSAVLVIPHAYPSVSPVVMKTTYSWMTSRAEAFLADSFSPGSEVLLQIIQFLRDIAEEAGTGGGDMEDMAAASVAVERGSEAQSLLSAPLDNPLVVSDNSGQFVPKATDPIYQSHTGSVGHADETVFNNNSSSDNSGAGSGGVLGTIFSALTGAGSGTDATGGKGDTELSTFYQYRPMYGDDSGPDASTDTGAETSSGTEGHMHVHVRVHRGEPT